jgi:hypothetical protein
MYCTSDQWRSLSPHTERRVLRFWQAAADVEPAQERRAEGELQRLEEKMKDAEMQVGRWRGSYGGAGSLRAERRV